MEPIKTIRSVPIDTAALGDSTIVPAVAGKKIRVVAYTLISSGPTNARWKSGAANNISGPLPLAANTGASPGSEPPGYLFETNAGEALVLNLSAAVQVSGHLSYQTVTPPAPPIPGV